MKEFNIIPVAKPRMTRRDKWKRRDCVLRYRVFCDEVRLDNITLEPGYHVTFVLPMPAGWSHKKREQMNGKPHQQKPDKDNLEKALPDACFTDDSHIWDGRVTKIWGKTGKIFIHHDCPATGFKESEIYNTNSI